MQEFYLLEVTLYEEFRILTDMEKQKKHEYWKARERSPIMKNQFVITSANTKAGPYENHCSSKLSSRAVANNTVWRVPHVLPYKLHILLTIGVHL